MSDLSSSPSVISLVLSCPWANRVALQACLNDIRRRLSGLQSFSTVLVVLWRIEHVPYGAGDPSRLVALYGGFCNL